MQTLKKFTKNSNNPVAQIMKRVGGITCSKINNVSVLSNKPQDAGFQCVNGNICKVREVLDNEMFRCDVYKAKNCDPLYSIPIDSRTIGIVYIKDSNERKTVKDVKLCALFSK